MKTIKIILVAAAFICTANFSLAQNINWRGLSAGQIHLINLNIGWDYGSTIGIGYGYKLKTDHPGRTECRFFACLSGASCWMISR